MLPDRVIQRVLEGHPVVYPTTTLPALGCLPQAEALDRLFELKKRSGTKVVSFGVFDINKASTMVQITDVSTQILIY
ncbi:MAG: Sua5/YciO/YrdC/YwlC family protein, partial [Candidatus Thermoplasmatota archaeon]|nr:Sua5/YciO/YrdC/YwlC family protein [Candidatus Thermoplasmatota archaeon]